MMLRDKWWLIGMFTGTGASMVGSALAGWTLVDVVLVCIAYQFVFKRLGVMAEGSDDSRC